MAPGEGGAEVEAGLGKGACSGAGAAPFSAICKYGHSEVVLRCLLCKILLAVAKDGGGCL